MELIEELTPSMEEAFEAASKLCSMNDDDLILSDSSFLEDCETFENEMGVSGEAEAIDDFMDLSDTSFLEVCEAFENEIMMENQHEDKRVLLREEELINAMDLSSGNMEIGGKEDKERENADNAGGASKTRIDLKTVSSGDKSIEIFMKTLEDMVIKDKKVARLLLIYQMNFTHIFRWSHTGFSP